MPAGREDRDDALRARSNLRGGTNFTVGERRLTHPSVFVLARQRQPLPTSFVSFRVRRRRLSCLTTRLARRARRSRPRASSLLEYARCRELHGRRTPTDALVSFRVRASAQKLARQRNYSPSAQLFSATAMSRFAAPAGVKPSGKRTRFTFETSLSFFASPFQSPQ